MHDEVGDHLSIGASVAWEDAPPKVRSNLLAGPVLKIAPGTSQVNVHNSTSVAERARDDTTVWILEDVERVYSVTANSARFESHFPATGPFSN